MKTPPILLTPTSPPRSRRKFTDTLATKQALATTLLSSDTVLSSATGTVMAFMVVSFFWGGISGCVKQNISGMVYTPCTIDTQCRSAEQCMAGRCLQLCRTDKECGSNAICLNANHCRTKTACAAAQNCCLTNTDCAGNNDGEACVNHSCGAAVIPQTETNPTGGNVTTTGTAGTETNNNGTTTGNGGAETGISATCGDHTVSGAEICDDGNRTTETTCAYGTPTCTSCNADCTATVALMGSYCGDLNIDTNNGEICDRDSVTCVGIAPLLYGGESALCKTDCTGYNVDSCTPAAPLVGALGLGSDHGCAQLIAGTVRCWGNLALGAANTFQSSTAIDVIGLSQNALGLAVGGYHNCALLADKTVSCWGKNYSGQLGDGGTIIPSDWRYSPVTVAGLTDIWQLAAGTNHTCALLHDGSVWCWGENRDGQLGTGTTQSTSVPTQVVGLGTASGVIKITAGGRHNCALISGGTVTCWGADDQGQLGDGLPLAAQLTPVTITGLPAGVTAIDGGDTHTCAVTGLGALWCFGDDSFGQLGDGGANNDTSIPVQISPSSYRAVSAGGFHTCGLTINNTLHCWGWGQWGQLGGGANATVTSIATASTPILRQPPIAITAYAAHTCALLVDSSIQCWGENGSGELGIGNKITANRPKNLIGIP